MVWIKKRPGAQRAPTGEVPPPCAPLQLLLQAPGTQGPREHRGCAAQSWGLRDPPGRGWGKETRRGFGQRGSGGFGFPDDAFHMVLHHAQLLHHFSQEI